MSTLQNEIILENLFEEKMDYLISKNFHLLFGQDDLERVATDLALDDFLGCNP